MKKLKIVQRLVAIKDKVEFLYKISFIGKVFKNFLITSTYVIQSQTYQPNFGSLCLTNVRLYLSSNIVLIFQYQFYLNPDNKRKQNNSQVAPFEAVSSQRSEEIEPKAGIAIPNTRGQFAPKEKFMVIDNSKFKIYNL
jgi:hypothetical protein